MTVLSGALRFKLALALVLAAMLVLVRPSHSGDVVEYSLTTIALAEHGTADIRLSDIAIGKQLLPQLSAPYEQLEAGMREGRPQLYAAFTRGRGDAVYAIHFFGYSALAALPYKALELAGLPPMKCFQVVNLAALFVLGLSLYRLFGSGAKAFLALGLFMACGGMLYWHWSSPECVSAAGLLAALALFLSGAPVLGGLLAGLASQQNPTIVMFFGFAPLLRALSEYRADGAPGGWRAFLAPAFQPRYLIGVGAGVAVFSLPLLFNLWQYGVPNIIAKNFSDPALISLIRLVSFYFDFNQGMLIAIPGVLGALALWSWRSAHGWRREASLLTACIAFTLALAAPALAINNWNSGAAGVMRYAFWAGMPLVFALLLRLRRQPRWPLGMLLGVGLVQAAAMGHAASYGYTEFSPLARLALRVAPSLYHPEPEIFVERMQHHDDYIRPNQIYTRTVGGQTVTTLYNQFEPGIEDRLCGEGGALAADNDTADSARGWRYVDGTLRCVAGGVRQLSYQVAQFKQQDALKLADGWSAPEANGGVWDGVWSNGARSRIVLAIAPGTTPTVLSMGGHYFEDNTRTRVKINGTDLGWQRLDQGPRLTLPPGAAAAGALEIELQHESPHSPAHGGDARALALFLRIVTLR